MPPRKRKEPVVDGSATDSGGETKPKKAKKAAAPATPLDPAVPVNTVLPPTITLAPKSEGSVRIAAWNVCGINAANKKGMRFYVEAEDPDVLVLTETKSEEKDSTEFLWLKQRFQYRYYGVDQQKGYSGTAILAKVKPLNVVKGLPTLPDLHTESRCITAEYENCYVLATYVPNAGQGLKNMAGKERWNEAFEQYLRQLDAKKPVIWTGDQNVAPTDKDIRMAKSNWNKTAGYTEKEVEAFKRQLNPPADSGHAPLVDIWRARNPDTVGHYTYYGFRKDCRTKGIGWRLDFFILSERIVDRVLDTQIRASIYGPSDHVPIMCDIRGTL